ncbi:zinc finger CCCH domain-containing protein 6-like isoform X2 [Salvia hispanica]|uniref:zinc finger CCCH domain-containing protein 6-like isoform X2 n=1 Tax=Salvia hispanica TaxID=49212 RepID=UPI00200910F9|nr:zinc finger CCCH domain-containing protein 6-like isoform X2 [Salvia hispanica]
MGESKKSKRITWASEVNLCQFEVNREWKVVSGEESTEVEFQNQRERRVLEATYPRPSAIPPNPRLPVNAPGSIVDDRSTPLIRMTPIEEDDAELAPSVSHAADSGPMIPQQGNSMQPNIAQAALAALSSNKDQMNLIDCELLVRILSNPKSLQQLLAISFGTQHVPNMKPPHSSDSTISTNEGASVPELNVPYETTRAAPPHLRTGFVSTACTPPVADMSSAHCNGVAKDMSYYKSLIQQHGGSGGGVPTQSCGIMSKRAQEFTKSRDVLKSRTVKPCMFFNTPKGCRNGDSCTYSHDVNVLSSRKRMGCVTEVGAKRVKLGS